MKTIAIFFVLIVFHLSSLAQTDLEKYWGYEHRYKSNFSKLGFNLGDVIPISSRVIGRTFPGDPTNTDFTSSSLKYGDATVYVGHSLINLACGIKNMKSVNASGSQRLNIEKELESSRNQLFITLSALMRLDYNAEGYLFSENGETFSSLTLNGNNLDWWQDMLNACNGYFLRDDVPSNYSENFADDYSQIFETPANFAFANSDVRAVNVWGADILKDECGEDKIVNGNLVITETGELRTLNRGAGMSIDQVITILDGLLMTYSLLDETDNVHVDFIPGHNEFDQNLPELARTLANKIIDYILRPIPERPGYYACNILTPKTENGVSSFYFRPAGGDATFYAPFLIDIAARFNHPMWKLVSRNQIVEEGLRIQFQTDGEKLSCSNLESLFPACSNYLEDIYENNTIVGAFSLRLDLIRGLYDNIAEQDLDFRVEEESEFALSMEMVHLLKDLIFHIELFDGHLCNELSLLFMTAISNEQYESYISGFVKPILDAVYFRPFVNTSNFSMGYGGIMWNLNANFSIQISGGTNVASVLRNQSLFWVETLFMSCSLIMLSEITTFCTFSILFTGECDLPLFVFPAGNMSEDLVRMTLEMSAMSGLMPYEWVEENAFNLSNGAKYDLSYLALVYRALHDPRIINTSAITVPTAPINISIPKLHFELIYFGTAPCLGSWDDPFSAFNTDTESTPLQSGQAEPWKSTNLLLHPGARKGIEEKYFRGEYCGLDYMTMYNLFHLNYSEELENYEKNLTCNCVREFTNEFYIDYDFTINSKFPEYNNYHIDLESFLSHNLVIENPTDEIVTDVKSDVILCSTDPAVPTTLTFGQNTTVNLYKGYSITVKSGNTLRFVNGAIINAGADWNSTNDDKFKIVLEQGAQLDIEGSVLNYDFSGLEIIAEDSTQINFLNSQINRSADLGGGNIVGENVSMKIWNCDMNTEEDSQPWDLRLGKSSLLSMKDSDLDIAMSSFTITDNSTVKAENSTLLFNHASIFVTTFSNFEMLDTHLNISNVSWFELNNGSELEQHEGVFFILENSNLSVGGLKLFEPISRYKYYGGDVVIEGENSKMFFDGGELYVMPNQTFAPFNNVVTETGYIEFSNKLDLDLYTDATSHIYLKGKGINDKILVLNDWANLQNANFGLGDLTIEDGLVDMSGNGQIWTDMNFQLNNVKFIDLNAVNIGLGPHFGQATVQVFYNNSCHINNSLFTEVKLFNYDGRTTVNSTEFTGSHSGFDSQGGRYKLHECSFTDCCVKSDGLLSQATISNCNFENPLELGYDFEVNRTACIQDLSLVKILVTECAFENAPKGIIQANGTLAVKCSSFSDISEDAIEKNGGDLEMSISIGSGYNQFRGCYNGVYLRNALSCELFDGYNDFSGIEEKVIYGTLPFECEPGNCLAFGNAEHNYWGENSSNSNQIGAIDFSTPQEEGYPIFVYSSIDNCGSFESGAECEFHFTDLNPTFPVACNSVTPRVKPEKNLMIVNGHGQLEKSKNQNDEQATNKNLNDSIPTINTTHFVNLPLDSALQFAASYLLDYNDNGSDEEAINLFHEIITADLDINDSITSYMLEWGRQRMKPAIERLLEPSVDVSETAPAISFDLYTQKYVDVLNVLTDTVLTRGTYKRQFYRELDKAQLFRMLGRSDIAQFVFEHLDDCALDSTEQKVLNYWIGRSLKDLALDDQYIVQNIPPDSLYITEFNYSFPELISVVSSNYYFGLWINGPQSFEFVGCGDEEVWDKRMDLATDYKFAPNPNNGTFTINGNFCKDSSVKLYDPQGKIIKAIRVNSEVSSVRVNLTNTTSSWATVVIESCGSVYTEKVVFVN